MSARASCSLALAVGLSLALAGCEMPKWPTDPAKPAEAPEIPPEIIGTVAEYAHVVGGGSLLLDGHGLVVGLGKNGSTEVPPQLKKYLVEYMLKRKVGSVLGAAAGVTPSQMLADPDTAVVRMVAVVPPGAPRDWRFDIRVTALSRTGTRSLDGGVLYPFPMFLATGEGMAPSSGARAWAEAEGAIFVNPFLDPREATDGPRFREGRIIGGGRVLEPRPIRLVVRDPDYARANIIQRRINQRFGRGSRIANAKNSSTIELNIPTAYLDQYEYFLQLVTHLPLQSGPGKWEARAREIAAEMERPGVNHEGLALVWEAMGPEVTGVCRTLYASKSPAASFYAARAGLRMHDDMAGDVLIRLAETVGSPFQVPAINELARHPWMSRSLPALRRLIDDPSDLVRIAAYEALVDLDDTTLITRVDVGDEFGLDLVRSQKSYVIYATQARRKRIALFGRDMTVVRRLFFDFPGLLTVADKAVPVDEKGRYVDISKLTDDQRAEMKLSRQDKLMVFRTIPRTGGISAPFYLDFSVRALIEKLGRPAERDVDGSIKGLGLTYGQVVAVLYRMCEVGKDIPAKFVLQPPPGKERIYRGSSTIGRPDMPGE